MGAGFPGWAYRREEGFLKLSMCVVTASSSISLLLELLLLGICISSVVCEVGIAMPLGDCIIWIICC